MKAALTAHHKEKLPNCGSWLNYWFLHSAADSHTPYCAAFMCPIPAVRGVTARVEAMGEGVFVIPVCPEHAECAEFDIYSTEPLARVE